MADRKPQPGDRVRVTFEGDYVGAHKPGHRIALDLMYDGVNRYYASVSPDAVVEVLEPALCAEVEGMTGIACQLPKGHIVADGSLRTVHEGTATASQTKYVGYEMFVRWPTQPEVIDAKTLPTPPAVTAEPRPKLSAYSIHLRDHQTPVDDCEYCGPKAVQS